MSRGTAAKANDSDSDDSPSDLPLLIDCTDDEVEIIDKLKNTTDLTFLLTYLVPKPLMLDYNESVFVNPKDSEGEDYRKKPANKTKGKGKDKSTKPKNNG